MSESESEWPRRLRSCMFTPCFSHDFYRSQSPPVEECQESEIRPIVHISWKPFSRFLCSLSLSLHTTHTGVVPRNLQSAPPVNRKKHTFNFFLANTGAQWVNSARDGIRNYEHDREQGMRVLSHLNYNTPFNRFGRTGGPISWSCDASVFVHVSYL